MHYDSKSNYILEGRVVHTDLVPGGHSRASDILTFNETYNQWMIWYPHGNVVGNNYYLILQVGKTSLVYTYALSSTENPKQVASCRWYSQDMPLRVNSDAPNDRLLTYYGFNFGTFYSFFKPSTCSITASQERINLNLVDNSFLSANAPENRMALLNYDPKRILPSLLTSISLQNTNKKTCALDELSGYTPAPKLIRFVSQNAYLYGATSRDRQNVTDLFTVDVTTCQMTKLPVTNTFNPVDYFIDQDQTVITTVQVITQNREFPEATVYRHDIKTGQEQLQIVIPNPKYPKVECFAVANL